MKKILNYMKNNKIKSLLMVAGFFVLGLLLTFFLSNKNDKTETIKVSRENIKEIVEVSGSVETAQNADLSFEKSGIVASLNVKVGDVIKNGQVLATLSGSDAYSAVNEAQAGVQSAQANLNNVKSGATQAEIDLKQQSLDNAKADLENANLGTGDTFTNVQNSIRDIIDYKLVGFFVKDSGTYKLDFSNCDQALQTELESERSNFDYINVNSLDEAKVKVDSLNSFINKINSLISMSCSVDSSLSSKKTAISSIKSQIQLLYSDISNKRTIIQNAKNAVARAEKDLNISISSVDKNKIAIAQASLSQAYARLSSARAGASKNVLVAPFSGVVSAVNIEKGELASVSGAAISIISDSKFQIKSKIAEADITKLSVGDKATVTIDAIPDKTFNVVVGSIDPASVSESGVPRYGITLVFEENYPELKSGLTANAKISTKEKENVLVIPALYVSMKSGGGVVKVKLQDGKIEEKIVELGIRSSEGKIEIIKGLAEGEELVSAN